MLELPKVDLKPYQGDIRKMIEVCRVALIKKGEELNQQGEYLQAL